MKTLAILIFTALTTFSSYASVVEPITTTIEGKTITVFFDDDKSELVTISIVDKVGFELLEEEVQTKNRKSRSYNLKQLPLGTYTIKIEGDQKIVYKEIKTERNGSVVVSEKTAFKPNSTFDNNRWKINLLSQGKNVDIKILDANYETIFEDKIKDKMVLAKAYNLEELNNGVYTLSVRVGNEVYNKVIAKM